MLTAKTIMRTNGKSCTVGACIARQWGSLDIHHRKDQTEKCKKIRHSERSEESPVLVLPWQSRWCGDSSHTLRVAQNDKFLGFAFNHYIMRDVTARQGRAPALQGYLYTHYCEIFRLCER